MALFADGAISTMADLKAQDSAVLDVANTEGIDITRKLLLAQEELGIELCTILRRPGPAAPDFVLPGAPGIESVVVTPALRLWHTFGTLELIYRDAYHSQLNDRYGSRRDQYRNLKKWAAEKLLQAGIGIATAPVPQASKPDVVPGSGSLPEGVYYITMAWINERGETGASAVALAIALPAESAFIMRPAMAPRFATGWHVYSGLSPEKMVRQNSIKLKPSDVWVQQAGLSSLGDEPPTGQSPNYFWVAPRQLQRG
jgi:hypothetical protein